MTRVALDSNILIYAELEPDSEKGKRATGVILGAARDGVIWRIDGLRLINPFAAANANQLAPRVLGWSRVNARRLFSKILHCDLDAIVVHLLVFRL